MRAAILLIASLLILPSAALLETSCGNATVTAPAQPPNSPQSTVALMNKSIADANLAAVKTVIALRDAGKISQANTLIVQNWMKFVADTNKSIGLILQKPEPWADQKREILTLLVTVSAPSIVTAIDPGAQAAVAQIMTLVNTLKAQVQP